MAILRKVGRGLARGAGAAGLMAADVAGALPLIGAAGAIGAGAMKGAKMFGGGKTKPGDVTPVTPLAGESSADAVQTVLEKILVDATAIREVIASKTVPEAEKKEIALDEEVRHNEMIEAILGRNELIEGEEEEKESWWDRIKKFMKWVVNPKTWIKALAGTLIVKSLLKFMVTVGRFLLGPVGLALMAVLIIAINWPSVKKSVKAFLEAVKDYVQAILNASGINALIDFFSTETDDVDDFADMPGTEEVPIEDDMVGDAQFEQLETAEPIPIGPIQTGQLEVIDKPPKDDTSAFDETDWDKFLDDVMAGKKPDKEAEVTGDVFATGAAADKFLDDIMNEPAAPEPQTKITGTMGEGGVSMQIPTMAALSRAFQAEEPKPLSEEEQFKKDMKAQGRSDEAIALMVRMKFRSDWEKSLTTDEEQLVTQMKEGGASQKAIKHRIKMDRDAREQGYDSHAAWMASIDDAPVAEEKTYNEGWQKWTAGGGWEDVADQKVPTIDGEKGISTLSGVRYRQKEGSDEPGSVSTSSLKSSPTPSAQSGSNTIQNGVNALNNVFNKASTAMVGDGASAQLALQLMGAGKFGQRVIVINTDTDLSTTFATSTDNTQTYSKGFSVNNNHTQPPQTGRDA